MSKDLNWLVHDHRRFEEALDECVLAADVNDWKEATKLFKNFVRDIQVHMQMEDEVLYPLVEEESGDPEGKLEQLRDEHGDLVRLVKDIIYVIKTRDFDHLEQCLEPLIKTMTEHNDHEEAVFQSLGPEGLLTRRDEIMAQLDAHSQHSDWHF